MGMDIEIHTVFQVWTKINKDKIKIPQLKTCGFYVDIFLSDGGKPANTRNKDMIEGAMSIFPPQHLLNDGI